MGWTDILTNPIGTLSGWLGQHTPTNPGGAATINDLTAGNTREQARLQQQQLQAFRGQQQLAGSLNNTINNPNAPSVALTQLGQGLSAIGGEQRAMASGASGENAFAMRRAAMQGIAGAGASANAAAQQERAQEVENAQQQLGQLYAGMSGTALGGATSLAGTNMGGQTSINTTNSAAQLQNAKQNASLLGTLGSGLAAIG